MSPAPVMSYHETFSAGQQGSGREAGFAPITCSQSACVAGVLATAMWMFLAASAGLQPVLPGRSETVAEDHQRRALGLGHEQPGAALVAGGREGDIASRDGSRGHAVSLGG